jgi:pyruvate formate lyase activating enzyme
MKTAMFYKKLNENKVKCNLCNHHCIISEFKRGICGVRENKKGVLYSLVYGKVIAKNIDPIEKKPMFHFLPGSLSYSIATIGCNFCCSHCQNWSISQVKSSSIFGGGISPEKIVNNAIESGCKSIAYTYTEPTVFYEYAYDVAKIAHKKGLKNIFVTNGYISKDALNEISHYLDGANIDLKSFSTNFYKNICGAKLQPILDNIKLYYDLGIWIELTTLIIPGLNDEKDELRKIAEFIGNIDVNIPWHVTGFSPNYKLKNISSTKLETLDIAVEIGKKAGLKYVYQGNIRKDENTYCPKCNRVLIKRNIFNLFEFHIKNDKCSFCGEHIDGKWNI